MKVVAEPLAEIITTTKPNSTTAKTMTVSRKIDRSFRHACSSKALRFLKPTTPSRMSSRDARLIRSTETRYFSMKSDEFAQTAISQTARRQMKMAVCFVF